MTDQIDLATFREQMKEDFAFLKESCSSDEHIQKDAYVFNYWILTHIYSMDPEVCRDNITEHNDKGIDCFVHHKENKELYIIQNKYYSEDTPLDRKEISDFLKSPTHYLDKGNYKNAELQEAYNAAKQDSEYKIFLHFYVSNDKKNADFRDMMKKECPSSVTQCELFYLSDIKKKYYGKSYKDDAQLKVEFTLESKDECMIIHPQPGMLEAYYTMTKVTDVYKMWQRAEKDGYPLFEKNIREYLGGTGQINKGIIDTLNKEEEKKKFFYYNNGITITCDGVVPSGTNITITNPQVVNGCQTVNSIAEALSKADGAEHAGVYVMAKILVIKKGENEKEIRDHVVEYTNKQNAINPKVFGAGNDVFFKVQEGMKKHGILLVVKQSDKHSFKKKYQGKERGLVLKANKEAAPLYSFGGSIASISMPLETLLQVIGAYQNDAYFAYTRKAFLLKQSSSVYSDFSIKISDVLTISSMVKLTVLFKKADADKKKSEDKRSPSPFYLLNCLGHFLDKEGKDKVAFLNKATMEDLAIAYEAFKSLSSKYIKKMGDEYNNVLKTKVNKTTMDGVLDEHFGNMKEHNPEKYEQVMRVFK